MVLYAKPSSWVEAFELLRGDSSVVKVGGCDLLPRYRQHMLDTNLIVGLNLLPGVGDLRMDSSMAWVAAGVTLGDFSEWAPASEYWPTLAAVAGTIASPAIRNAGTVVGNVVQGWTRTDIVPILQAYDARLVVRSAHGERKVSVEEYSSTLGTGELRSGEIVAGMELPIPPPEYRVAYRRFSLRKMASLPVVGVAVGMESNYPSRHTRVSVTGGRQMPTRCGEAELEIARGAERLAEASAQLCKWADPVEDCHGSAAFRRHMVGVMFGRAAAEVVRSAEGVDS